MKMFKWYAQNKFCKRIANKSLCSNTMQHMYAFMMAYFKLFKILLHTLRKIVYPKLHFMDVKVRPRF